MARLLMLSLLVVCGCGLCAGLDSFRNPPREVRLFVRDGGGAPRDYPRKYSIGLNTGGGLAYEYGVYTFGLSTGYRMHESVGIIEQVSLDLGMSRALVGLVSETGPRFYLTYTENEGAYIDLRLSLALYMEAYGGWATSIGPYAGGGYEYGTDWFRGFADLGVRVMAPLSSGADEGIFSANTDKEMSRDRARARRIASFQLMLRIGVRFYFRP